MEYRNLGKWGLKVSKFGLGGWATYGENVNDQKIVNQIVRTAYDAGINFFDMADVYARGESEKMMGKALREFPRHTLVLSSKIFWPLSDDVNDRGLSRKHIIESVEKTLQRIGTDYLDLYFCHRFDPETPIEETARALDDLVHQGKILYWGTSMWSSQQITEAQAIAAQGNFYAPVVEQPLYNLIDRKRYETEIAPMAEKFGMGIVTFSPLASGFLTGKYDDGIPEGSRMARLEWLQERYYQEQFLKKLKSFKDFAENLGISRAQLAIAWVAAQKTISSVILGATRVEQLQENLEAAEITITREIDEQLQQIFPANEE
ncbi:MAG: aldo/keto reductase [Calditrichaeota bacterium]|nr:aldo/keto reductase [Calditrichota bacterium]